MHQFHRLATIIRTMLLLAFISALYLHPVSFAQSNTNDIRITPPTITRGVDSVTINWFTEPASISWVEYMGKEATEWKKTPPSEVNAEKHSIKILNLLPDSTYLFRINAEYSQNGEKITTTRPLENFTTLKGDVLGDTQVTPSTTLDEGGFKTLLTPYATIPLTPTPISNPWDPYTSQGYQFMPFYPIPIPIAYQPVLGTQTQQEPQTAPTATPLPPTPTPLPVSGSVDSGSVTLIVGLFAGVLISFLLHQLSQPGKNVFRHDITNKLQKPKEAEITSEHQTYKFSINND